MTLYRKLLVFILIFILGFIILNVTKDHEKEIWVPGDTKFSISWISYGNNWGGKIIIDISEQGEYLYEDYGQDDPGSDLYNLEKTVKKQLSDEEMKELFIYMINEVDFFSLKEDMSNQNVSDASSDFIKVRFNGKEHEIGGYGAVVNEEFERATKKFSEIVNKYHK